MIQKYRSNIIGFFSDREYYVRLFRFAVPIALQQLIFSSLNLVSSIMVGQLGNNAVASVGLANQIFFLLNLFIFGIGSGSAMFTAQLWGKKDIPNIRKVLGLALSMALLIGVLFITASEFAPTYLLRIYTRDQAVIQLGSQYLQIFGWSFPFFAITFTYAIILRSVGEVRLPVTVSVSALSLNILLSYLLIFGKLGLPMLGINGAAYAILISRVVECLALLFFTYKWRLPPAASLREMTDFNLLFARAVFKPVLPVAINEVLWSLGITTYAAIYARISTDAVATMNIVGTIDGMAVVAFIGIGNATAILVGNQIGEGDPKQAYRYAGRSLVIAAIGGLVMGCLIILISPFIVNLYKVSPEVIQSSKQVLMIVAVLLWLRMMNTIQFIGIFRAGGDTRFGLVLDGLIIWVIGVPLTAIGAFVLHLPVHLVYLCTMSEESCKWALGLWRYFSNKWIHNLVETVKL